MAFTAVEDTNILKELAIAFSENCPTVKQVFLDNSGTYAQNLTDLKVHIDTITAALFHATAPTVLP